MEGAILVLEHILFAAWTSSPALLEDVVVAQRLRGELGLDAYEMDGPACGIASFLLLFVDMLCEVEWVVTLFPTWRLPVKGLVRIVSGWS
jgi:hypothetical protein